MAGIIVERSGSRRKAAAARSKPGAHHAAAAPDFGDVGQVDVVDVVVAHGRRLGVGLAFFQAGVGVGENVEAFAIGGHACRIRCRCGPS